MTSRSLNLSMVPECMREAAAAAFADGDVARMLCTMSNTDCLPFVSVNMFALQAAGIYEAALIDAYNRTRTNLAKWKLETLEIMFRFADRDKLRAAGDPLPPGERFTLYRGVAGKGVRRRESGMSWTLDLAVATWFARRYSSELHDPAVYETTVAASQVYCYINAREEQEFILRARKWRRLDI
jgi:hypothetical protein